MIIARPDIAEEAFDSLLVNIRKNITDKGNEVVKVDQWGKRKLAYPISGLLEGRYVLVSFTAKASTTDALVSGLRISEDVIRYMLVNLDEN